MPTMTATQARKELFPLLAQVNDDHDVVRISSKAGTAVLMSEADYEAWQTTLYLLSNPANARRLNRSLADARVGQVKEMPLDELYAVIGED